MYYFASDIHLGVADKLLAREIEQRFIVWLDEVSKDADAIFLLGDIFDFWFEYNNVAPKGFVRVLGKLAELTDRGVRVVFLTGNHDMWINDYFEKECGMEVYTKPQLLTIANKKVFIAHGDNMNIDNQPLLKLLNRTFRSTIMKSIFSWIFHPDILMHFGLWWSAKSRESHSKNHAPIDYSHVQSLVEYAREYSKTAHVDYFVFGHMHTAKDNSEGDLRVINLGCWDREPSYAVLDECGEISLNK